MGSKVENTFLFLRVQLPLPFPNMLAKWHNPLKSLWKGRKSRRITRLRKVIGEVRTKLLQWILLDNSNIKPLNKRYRLLRFYAQLGIKAKMLAHDKNNHNLLPLWIRSSYPSLKPNQWMHWEFHKRKTYMSWHARWVGFLSLQKVALLLSTNKLHEIA